MYKAQYSIDFLHTKITRTKKVKSDKEPPPSAISALCPTSTQWSPSMTSLNTRFQRLLPVLFSLCILLMSTAAMAKAGGGDASERGSMIMLLLLLPVILGAMAYRAIMKTFSKQAAKSVLRKASSRDQAWSQDKLKQRAKHAFVQLQQHWSSNDVDGSRQYLHPDYQDIFLSDLRGFIARGERNDISQVNVRSVDIVLAKDFQDDSQDTFVAQITGQMNDSIVGANGAVIRTQGNRENNPARNINEYWSFQRSGEDWLVSNISEDHDVVTQDVSLDAQSLAAKHRAGDDLDHAVMKAQVWKERSKTVQRLIATAVGLTIAVAGYWLYFMIFGSIWKAVTGLF
jgi:hypothetical protein